jgi:hypothetical protein
MKVRLIALKWSESLVVNTPNWLSDIEGKLVLSEREKTR